MRINIKPLSVNQSWKGRHFKTAAYKAYEQTLMYTLPKLVIPSGSLILRIKVGFSSKGSDIDNVLKPFLDVLSKKYGFNDNRIYKLEIEKRDVKKGSEYIDFEINRYENKNRTI